MSRAELEEKMVEFIATTYNKEESEITMETKFVEDLGGQSILMVGLASLIENELDVLVSLPVAGACKTVGELTDKVEELL